MSAQKEITISGVGGQGMILCGTLLAEGAAIHDHKRATLSSEYGVETRGTFAKSDVIISDNEIYFPDVTDPDLIVCLHQVAYERYSGKVGDKALILYNADEIKPNPRRSAFERGINITTIAKGLGNPAMANILTMGIIVGVLGVITPEGAKNAIGKFFSKKGEKVVGLNYAAFNAGLEIGQKLK